ncbi:hypothetical protein HMPREF1554_00173 [Porphyromonas gingivalis F0569]|uniref:Uncharacterized protein n=1 Tax=Porphyromonas gingivalis F0570 TaxID=1227271 RepID=A0A0E2LQB3_PORGN|nr:hypothetical protein HMPREF1555_01447 [Porphyromonas gingivalis F0570]ERJ71423.1 hypothetical protein HMPREF1554_00173 [Porphyromonas gingivalis F0569]ERJ82024.1 hypothetical protein HMPREF1988_01806 [Porphyromonas gingivalis F0185]
MFSFPFRLLVIYHFISSASFDYLLPCHLQSENIQSKSLKHITI